MGLFQLTDNSVKKLRDRENVRFFDKQRKEFIHFQLNKKDKNICWERWTSKDKANWINQNLYLSLKDIKLFVSKLNK